MCPEALASRSIIGLRVRGIHWQWEVSSVFSVNDLVLVSDPVEALSEESGRFLITSPSGETMEIRLESGYVTIERVIRLPELTRADLLWQVIKIGELR